jgi:hypothetical protein
MRTFILLSSIGFFILAASQPASAQFSAPIRYNEGPGLKLSDTLVFHPGAEIEGRYDSNALYEKSDPNGAGYLRLIGHLDLATLSPQRLTDTDGNVSPQKVDFRLKSALAFRNYFSSNTNVTAQRALEVDAGLSLMLFPQSVFSFGLMDDFARTVQPRGGETEETLSRDTNRGTVKFVLAPGGRRLTFDLAYSMNLDLFEDSSINYLNRMFHEIAFTAKWKLLPKTAIGLEYLQQIYNYYNTIAAYPRNNSTPARVYLGFYGLITTMLSAVIKVGYGNALYSKGDSYNNVIGLAELGFQLGPLAKIKLGFDHNFGDGFYGNYYRDELVYLGYDHFIASRFLLHLKGDYRYRAYSGAPEPLNQNLVTLGIGFDYQIQEWIYVGIGYDLELQNVIKGPTSYVLGATEFAKHQIFAKVGVSY